MKEKEYELLLVTTDENAYLQIKDKFFEKFSVAVKKEDVWGERRLAYPIKKKLSGYYVVLAITLPPENIAPLGKALELEDAVLRNLLFRK